ncbi:MAG: hypothetical protein ACRDEA_22365 [Microcystaceae cyanobacterium]
MLDATVRRLSLSGLIVLPLILALAPLFPTQAQDPNSSTPKGTEPTQTEEDLTDPNNLRPLNQSDSLLSLQGGERLMKEASDAISAGNYNAAANKLQEARRIFNQLSNFYLQLANSFSGIDPSITEAQKGKALTTGEKRDEATYQLALVHRAQNQSELAVPLLIQVIRSQNPTSELGKKSYQQLYEIGFVDTPYGVPASEPTSNTSSTTTNTK